MVRCGAAQVSKFGLDLKKNLYDKLTCYPRGGTCCIHDGEGGQTFFRWKIFTLSIFFGQEICHIIF